jgi:CheY-like chemotaxis protein
MGAGHLLDAITRELAARRVFIVILSKSAFASTWVRQECQWVFQLYMREPDRVILPITAQPIEASDFNEWLFLESFRRIEATGYQPLPPKESIDKALNTLVLTPDEVSSEPRPSRSKRTQGSQSVLWVDDRPSNQLYERRALEQLGITFTISTSTDDAVGKLVQHHYDAIISDMSRPPDDRAGYALLDQVRRLRPAIPVIFYTSSRDPRHVLEAKARGAYGQTYLTAELFDLVQAALERK